MSGILKYPRTKHLEGSRLQPGDEDLDQVPLDWYRDRHVVVEEKLDGANCGIRFDAEGRMSLQSRGHVLRGGARERHFALFKTWAPTHRDALWAALGSRYVMYGEWLYAKHTIYYDQLPHFFLEFDILDTETGSFLETDRRVQLLQGTPIRSVPVLRRGLGRELPPPSEMITRSLYKGAAWRERLSNEAASRGIDVEQTLRETDLSDEAEGLYIKVEEGGVVQERLKWIRASFLTAVLDSGDHWMERPILPNALAEGVDIFAR